MNGPNKMNAHHVTNAGGTELYFAQVPDEHNRYELQCKVEEKRQRARNRKREQVAKHGTPRAATHGLMCKKMQRIGANVLIKSIFMVQGQRWC